MDAFDEVFLIIGTVTDVSKHEENEDLDLVIGPRKVPPTFREVEVTQGRRAVTTKVLFSCIGRANFQICGLNP